MIELREPFRTLWYNKNPFSEADKLHGEVFRKLESRRTLRFTIEDKSYFIKIHYGTTLKEVLKNLVALRLPVLGADREWHAIHRLSELGVDTMQGCAFGQQGINPLRRHSFIITEDLTPTISLEDYCADWSRNPPNYQLKKSIIQRVAIMVKKMHLGGINHRDCYICHFLLHLPIDQEKTNELKISVIDLHRAQIRNAVPIRWRNKDIIGLYFSSLNIGLTKKDILYFLKNYFSLPLRDILKKEEKLINQAVIKAEKIKERTARKSL